MAGTWFTEQWIAVDTSSGPGPWSSEESAVAGLLAPADQHLHFSVISLQAATGRLLIATVQEFTTENYRGTAGIIVGGRVSSHLSETLSIMAAEPLYSLEESGPREFPHSSLLCPVHMESPFASAFSLSWSLFPSHFSLMMHSHADLKPAFTIPSGISCVSFCLCIALFLP